MIFWLIMFFIGGTVFGAGLMCILTSGKTGELYNIIDSLTKQVNEYENKLKDMEKRMESYPTYDLKI